MIIHLINSYEAERLPRDILFKAYLVSYADDDNTIKILKCRSVPSELVKRGIGFGQFSISKDEYKELYDFIIDTYYPSDQKITCQI